MREAWTSVEVLNDGGTAPVALICEHAAHAIPDELEELGLGPEARHSHAAWDIGARDVAVALSELMDAPLVAGTISRLVYDCNRPPEAPDAIPARSEVFDIPGNRDLQGRDRARRVAEVHDPFHAEAARVAAGRAALVTVHSFTPVYHGKPREVEIGYLCHRDARLADAALAAERGAGRYRAALNEPYAPSDGVTYTLKRHGEDHGRPALMIEVRNDLIATGPQARAMAEHLHPILRAALAEVGASAASHTDAGEVAE
ncbi:N-formylglutamate amidohydrolase [Roseivivax marinus]|uniref:N-formylglutamate amidohydrolase n=1 Tax=Roseivivax marinus TaxID=1379903 RepID=W4HFV9_9RHOB|nr:N-formylglutamate amidohydrolase [Roseivivax marinus]ETW11652.1 N-formylglutamate amidohydrolase [Roseivivax marinus]